MTALTDDRGCRGRGRTHARPGLEGREGHLWFVAFPPPPPPCPFFRMLCFVISRSYSFWRPSDIIEDADPDASDSEFLTPRGTPKKLPQQHGSQFGSQFGDDSEMGDGEIFEGGATPRNGNDDADDNLAAELARYVLSASSLSPIASADVFSHPNRTAEVSRSSKTRTKTKARETTRTTKMMMMTTR